MRVFSAIILLGCTGIRLNAQQLLLKSGINASTITMGYQEKFIRMGAVAGIGIEFPISKSYLIQIDVQFIQKGYKVERQFGGVDYGIKIFDRKILQLNYVEAPYFLKYKVNGSNNVVVSFLIGQSIGYGISGLLTHYSYSSHEFPPQNQQSETITKVKFKYNEHPSGVVSVDKKYATVYNRVEYSFIIGTQIEFFKKVIVDLRYGLGMTNLYHSETAKNSRNLGLQVCVAAPIKFTRTEGREIDK